jgi:phosphatidylglycerophosphate synthase
MPRLPVFLYIPNVLCYMRIIVALIALSQASHHPEYAVCLWITSALGDLIDGWFARRFQQTSTFGVLLDVIADNIWRSSVWMAVGANYKSSEAFMVLACIITSLEWLTFFATQFHAATQRAHWKSARTKDPRWIQSFFRRHFRNPLGIWGVLGLFGAGLCAFARVNEIWPTAGYYKSGGSDKSSSYVWALVFHVAEGVCYSGRVLSMSIELYLLCQYFSLLLKQDTEQREPVSVPLEIKTVPREKRIKVKK